MSGSLDKDTQEKALALPLTLTLSFFLPPGFQNPSIPRDRWLERHNAKLREAGKKDERKRLRAFVELAYEKDPRVQARKEQMKNARASRAAEKAAARNAGAKAEEEARLKAEAEAAAAAVAAAEAAVAAKKLREREKKAAQKARSRLRAAASAAGVVPGSAVDDEVESLCAALEATALDKLTEAITSGSPPEHAVAVAAGRVAESKDAEKEARDAARKKAEAAAATAAAAEAEAKARAWTDEEVRLLTRAVGKLPSGTPKRWEAVAAQVRTRTADECVAMVKHGLAAGKFSAAAAGGSFTVPAKRAGTVVIKDAATSRETSFTDVEVKLVGEAAKALAPPSATTNGCSASASPAKAAAASGEGGASPSSTSPPASPPPADAPAWTEEQELALVRALKTYGKELAAEERWAKVSAAVPGQSPAACLRRFKELKAAVKSTKKEG